MAKKILIIEDEKVSQALVKFGLKESLFDVLVAEDGDIGLKKVQQEHPDLIILDVGLPHVDGYQFIKELRTLEEFHDIPVIVLTSNETLENVFKLEGIKEYLIKPVPLAELVERVKLHLGIENDGAS